jgi:hypothetical protein
MDVNLNGIKITRVKDTIFIPLPKQLWRKIGLETVPDSGCTCAVCKTDGTKGYWDTLAVAAVQEDLTLETTWQVHYPELHNPQTRKQMSY